MIDKLNYPGMYRGVCVDNFDPEVRGRLKIHVPGVYPEELSKTPANLPWAEPIMPLWGGSWTNETTGCLNEEVGLTTIPHTSTENLQGAQLWVFFEAGDQNFPCYWGAVQASSGWLSENRNQHVAKTDNVRVRICEHPPSGDSTCFFDTYNADCTADDGNQVLTGQTTRVDCEIWCEEGIALNLQIKGSVNLKVVGNVYEEHIGNKHETLSGNLYRHHVGDVHIQHEGDTHIEHLGDVLHEHTGDRTYLQEGDQTEEQTGDQTYTQEGDKDYTQEGDAKYEQTGDLEKTQTGDQTIELIGDREDTTIGEEEITITKKRKVTLMSTYTKTVLGKYKTTVASTKETKAMMIKNQSGVHQDKAGIILHN